MQSYNMTLSVITIRNNSRFRVHSKFRGLPKEVLTQTAKSLYFHHFVLTYCTLRTVEVFNSHKNSVEYNTPLLYIFHCLPLLISKFLIVSAGSLMSADNRSFMCPLFLFNLFIVSQLLQSPLYFFNAHTF